ncbi:tachykinin-like peptides receptor 86C [Patiria miniata]|uniref:G-protein coupled receptors family 1 profile domain-containing protein n=1 Tax=Patiria miniata TaxID=46514 RepID=A0A914BHY7_PATMI|nr:tachykinin-like peptides receptor 86C [Patiria miniata]
MANQPTIYVTDSVTSGQPLLQSFTVSSTATALGGKVDFGLLFSVILSSMGMLGNALVCFVMLRHRKVFYSPTNKLIIHQSFVDLVASTIFFVRRFALAVPPIADGFIGGFYCRVWWSEWPMYGMFVTSTYNLVAISTERYVATCHPIKHRNAFSPFRLKLVMAAAWLAGWLPAAHLTLICYYDAEVRDCGASWPNFEVQAVAGTLIFVHEIIVPITVMFFAYSRIIWSLRRRSRVREGENNDAAREMFSKANRNVTITLVVVAAFFAICWLPTDIYYLLYNLHVHNNFVEHPVYQVFSVIVVLNLCINPLIYCFAYDRFRKKLKQEFCGNRWLARRVGIAEDGTSNDTGTRITVAAGRGATAGNDKTLTTTVQTAGCSFQTETVVAS